MKKIALNKSNYLKTVGAVFLSLGLYGCATVKTETNPFPEGSVRNALYSFCMTGVKDKAIEENRLSDYEKIKPAAGNMCQCFINRPETLELIGQWSSIKDEEERNPNSKLVKHKLANLKRKEAEIIQVCVKEAY